LALEQHLLASHTNDLEEALSNLGRGEGFSSLHLLNCPYCGAGFLKAQAAIRHLHYQHQEESRPVLLRNALSSGGSCRFCPQVFRPSHHRLALLHAEQAHTEELAEVLFGGTAANKPSVPCPPNSFPQEDNLLNSLDSPAPTKKTEAKQVATETSHFYHEIPDEVMVFFVVSQLKKT